MTIFTQGKCLKSELFTRIVDLMKSAGWTDVSSKYETDFFVMNSKGESGDKDLFIQFRPSNLTNASDIQTSTGNLASYRLINGYTPGAPTIAGVFERPSEAWKNLYISPSAVDPGVELTYWYTVNKNRIIINIYTPESLNMLPVMIYLGLPIHYTSEPKSKGVIAMTSYSSSYSNSVHISDNVPELPSATASQSLANQFSLAPKSPNSAGMHTPCELLFGNSSVGQRGKVDSIFFLPTNSINDGDTLRLGAKRYRATQVAISGNNSFPSANIIYQIS